MLGVIHSVLLSIKYLHGFHKYIKVWGFFVVLFVSFFFFFFRIGQGKNFPFIILPSGQLSELNFSLLAVVVNVKAFF